MQAVQEAPGQPVTQEAQVDKDLQERQASFQDLRPSFAWGLLPGFCWLWPYVAIRGANGTFSITDLSQRS